jgi:hypothetical protein
VLEDEEYTAAKALRRMMLQRANRGAGPMSRRMQFPVRSAWEDKYRKPSTPGLIGEVARPLQTVLEFARERLARLDGVHESLEWQGFPWRWSLVFRRARGAPGERALAYLVPQPARPLLVVPVPAEALERMERKKIARPVRDLVHLSPAVGPVRWCQFELSSKTFAEEVLELVRMLHAPAADPHGPARPINGVKGGSSRPAVLLRD